MAKILIVDDEPMIVRLLKAMLRDHELLVASNGIEALLLYSSYAPQIDLIITDLVMPQMGGYELLKRIRAINPAVRAIAITGYADQYPDEQTTTLLQKPFTLGQLKEAVQTNLEM